MKPVMIEGDRLKKAILKALETESFGLAVGQITELRGVISTGEAFPIDKIEVTLVTPTATQSRFTAPTGRGKIKLATLDGENVQ